MLRFLPEALAELEDAVEFTENARAGFGRLLLEEVERRIEQAARWPSSGSLVDGFPPHCEVRQFATSRFRHVVITAIVAGERMVVAVGHTSREPSFWHARIDE